MLVKLRLLLADLPAPSGLIEVELEAGSTVQQALEAVQKLHSIEDPEGLLPASMFIINQKPVELGAVLQEQDELLVMRILGGG